MSLAVGQHMFFPWYAFAMLAIESGSVVNRRLEKIGRGGAQSLAEIQLMFAEKADAAAEIGTMLISGSTAVALVDRLRVHVAENEARLSA
jgi:hypothetical protein